MVRIAIAVICLLFFSTDLNAQSERRLALVIGNSAYQHAGALADPANDAAALAQEFKTLGFEVIEGRDLDRADMDRTIRQFASALSGAEIGVFFYAGHAVQVDGQDYLVPIDAYLKDASQFDVEMVRLDVVLQAMERASKTNIIFIDASTNNPVISDLADRMGTRQISSGLAPPKLADGTLVNFSAASSHVAHDGSGASSAYTRALLKHIRSEQDLLTVLGRVQEDVSQTTGGLRSTWTDFRLRKRIYLVPQSVAVTDAPTNVPDIPDQASAVAISREELAGPQIPAPGRARLEAAMKAAEAAMLEAESAREEARRVAAREAEAAETTKARLEAEKEAAEAARERTELAAKKVGQERAKKAGAKKAADARKESSRSEVLRQAEKTEKVKGTESAHSVRFVIACRRYAQCVDTLGFGSDGMLHSEPYVQAKCGSRPSQC